MIKSYFEKRNNGNYSNLMFVSELAIVAAVLYGLTFLI